MIKIGNGCGFWGDSPLAPKELLQNCPDLDYLTLEYLAELTLSILAKSPLGYCADFLDVLQSIKSHPCKIITNAGGLNPKLLAEECKKICPEKKIAYLTGDDVSSRFGKRANAYLGAGSIAEALKKGAEIVITGRVADPSLTVAPCLAHFGWKKEAWDLIAQATVAGHLIECGAQATGGMSTDWLNVPHPESIGYPVVEMHSDGSFVLTKPKNSGGKVTVETVKEQLLYELFDPDHYLSPDATVSFTSLKVEDVGKDRVRVTGAKGSPYPADYKVSLSVPIGFRVEAMISCFGENAAEKGVLAAQSAIDHVKRNGFKLEETVIEAIASDFFGCVVRVAAFDPDKEGLVALSKEIAPLVTRGPQGIVGYAQGRPKVREVMGYSSAFIPRLKIKEEVHFL